MGGVEGKSEGTDVGLLLVVGVGEDNLEGTNDALVLGDADGKLGSRLDGWVLGRRLGDWLGRVLGLLLGPWLGTVESVQLGRVLGNTLGAAPGLAVGPFEGPVVGKRVGVNDGAFVVRHSGVVGIGSSLLS